MQEHSARHGGKDMENMGYSNTDAVYENVLSKGLLLKT